jgi:hypothetical protein
MTCRRPLGSGAMSDKDIQGDEWDAYVTLERMTLTNVGSPTGRESYGDRGPVLAAGVTPCRGGRRRPVYRAKGSR